MHTLTCMCITTPHIHTTICTRTHTCYHHTRTRTTHPYRTRTQHHRRHHHHHRRAATHCNSYNSTRWRSRRRPLLCSQCKRQWVYIVHLAPLRSIITHRALLWSRSNLRHLTLPQALLMVSFRQHLHKLNHNHHNHHYQHQHHLLFLLPHNSSVSTSRSRRTRCTI